MNVQQSLAGVLPSDALEAPEQTPGAEVVRPGSVEEVAAVMAWANREQVGVLPTGSPGECSVVAAGRPWIVLSTDRLAGVEIYEPADLTITVGAGSSFRDVDGTLRENGQWLPFDPPLLDGRTVGGLVAEGTSGPLWMGYGALCHHVLGATVVTGDGRRLALGGRVVKNVAGYDLLKLLVGSRGTLGVITSVCLRAFPVPEVDRVLVLDGDDVLQLVDVAHRVASAPVLPVSLVLVDDLTPAGTDRPRRPALVVRLHGAQVTVDADRETIERHAGVRFAEVSGAAPAGSDDATETLDTAHTILGVVRERAVTHDIVLDVSTRPSRLGAALDALSGLQPAAVVADAYAGRVRLGLDGIDDGAIESSRAAIEDLGGALRIAKAHGANAFVDRGTKPRPLETTLGLRLRATFDPGGVMWPTRTRESM